MLRRIAIMTLLSICTVAVHAQQPLLSPRDSTQVSFNGKRIFIDYGKPSMRGRKIMGELVPYTRWWRTGANEATSFKTDFDLLLGDSLVPKGNYTLYTLPSEATWKLIINKQTGQWGTVYNQELDFYRLPLKKRMLKQPLDKLDISLLKNGNGGGTLRIAWETTELTIPFRIKKAMKSAK